MSTSHVLERRARALLFVLGAFAALQAQAPTHLQGRDGVRYQADGRVLCQVDGPYHLDSHDIGGDYGHHKTLSLALQPGGKLVVSWTNVYDYPTTLDPDVDQGQILILDTAGQGEYLVFGSKGDLTLDGKRQFQVPHHGAPGPSPRLTLDEQGILLQ